MVGSACDSFSREALIAPQGFRGRYSQARRRSSTNTPRRAANLPRKAHWAGSAIGCRLRPSYESRSARISPESGSPKEFHSEQASKKPGGEASSTLWTSRRRLAACVCRRPMGSGGQRPIATFGFGRYDPVRHPDCHQRSRNEHARQSPPARIARQPGSGSRCGPRLEWKCYCQPASRGFSALRGRQAPDRVELYGGDAGVAFRRRRRGERNRKQNGRGRLRKIGPSLPAPRAIRGAAFR